MESWEGDGGVGEERMENDIYTLLYKK